MHHVSRTTHHATILKRILPWPKWRQWSISDSLYLRSRMYRILWRNPLGQLITRSNTDVTIGIDWQPNPWSMVSGKLGVTEHMLIEHGVFSAWQEYKRVFVAMRLSPVDTWQKKMSRLHAVLLLPSQLLSRSVFALIKKITWMNERTNERTNEWKLYYRVKVDLAEG